MTPQELLQETYFGNTILSYAEALGIVLLSVIVGKIVYYLINQYLKELFRKTENKLDDLLIDAIEEPLVVFIFTWGLYIALHTLVIHPNIIPLTDGIVTAMVVMTVAWLLIRVINIGVNEYLVPLARKTDSSLDDQLIPIFSKGLKAVVIVLGLLVVLSNFGIDITALVAGLGIGGLAVALASKDTVENMFGAFAILVDKPFTVRDRIIVDGVTGDVLEVGLRSTRLLTLDNTELYMPNSRIAMSKIENISRPSRHLAVVETICLTYETPQAKLREAISIVKEVLSKTDGVYGGYAPTVAFTDFADSSLNVMVKYWVNDYLDKALVLDRVNQEVKERFEKAGIEFAYPTQKVILSK